MLLLHEGEEFAIALPVVMLGAAFFLLKWAAAGDREEQTEEETLAVEPPAGMVEAPDLALAGAHSRHAAGETAVEPPDEGQPADNP